jgi:asparagine synthase (glutamine-hydrolysing)
MEPCAQSCDADRASIERMARAIAFRGPDSQQQSQRGGASFAFSFARTGPAPQSNVQPVTLDGTVWLIGDVRLDRREELIAGLTQRGERPAASVTDEEIVLLAWKLWREAGVRRIFFDEIYGDFSFALWESDRQELNCFRDVMGGRPFYYCFQDGVLAFSNTLQAIHHAPGFAGVLDREYVADFLLFSWCPRPQHTVYKSVRRLPAGHWLTFSANGAQVRRFQELPVEEPLFLRRKEEYIEIYRDLLGHAVKDRLPNGPAAIFLSGGMDSSTVAATVCALRKKTGAENKLHAVSADLQPLFDDQEGTFAAKAAEHLEIGFELSHLGGCTPFSGFDQFDIRFPEPWANPFRAIYLHLYRLCVAKSRVVFLGYGGDHVLTGQTGPYFRYLARRGQFSRAFSSFANYLIAKKKLPPLRVGIQSWLRKRLSLRAPQFPSWLAPSFEREFNLKERWQELQRGDPALHPIHPIGYGALHGTYWPQALDREDAAYTGLPLEIRTPFFDYRLLRFVLSLPALPWCVDKEIMRRAIRDALPDAVLRRAKAPLAKDPLELHAKKGAWRLVQQAAIPSPQVREFVDWPQFVASRTAVSAPALWTAVPPIALNYWLKGIEKSGMTR